MMNSLLLFTTFGTVLATSRTSKRDEERLTILVKKQKRSKAVLVKKQKPSPCLFFI
jgi:hypothetical protein